MNKKLWSVVLMGALTAGMGCTAMEDATGGGDDDTGTDGGSGGGGGNGARTCTTARLLAGDPHFTGELDRAMWNPAGHGMYATPPMYSHSLAGRGNNLLVGTGAALWLADLSAATPSFKRVAGDDALDPGEYKPSGTCAAARLMAGLGVTYLTDGRAVVGDFRGNGVFELSDVTSPSCMARPVAGTAVNVTNNQLDRDRLFQAGDVDGPGAQARFRQATLPTADGAGNVYVVDAGNHKIKKIAGDAVRTVTTITDLSSLTPTVHAMTVLGGKLYVAANGTGGALLLEIDLANPATPRKVLEGSAFADQVSSTAIPSGITNDGRDLIVYLWQGFIYRVTTGGEVTLIAGDGRGTRSQYDTDQRFDAIPAAELLLAPLSMTSGSSDVVWNNGHLYVSSYYGGPSIWDITCPQ